MQLVFGIELTLSSILKLRYGYHLFDAGSTSCQIHGTMISFLLRSELIVFMVLAFYRYFLVVHNIELKSWILISILTFFTTFIATSILYGSLTQEIRPNSSYTLCNAFITPSVISFTFNMALTLLTILPCWTTTYCYFSIGWKVNKRLNELKAEAIETRSSEALKIIRKQRFRLAIQHVIVFFLYNVNYSLSYITYFLRLSIGYKRPPFIDALSIFLGDISIMGTPMVTISFQPEVNNEFKIIFVKLAAKLKKAYNGIFNHE
ncbi:hypothetical protein CONCODRAFT_4276 [Conidiobolus coronatus NRRL 28638]|uniref:G-protein coupled receptors family 1 profile domain-containing protein n=1 Tax=Conidiobolus coronatus (strain ATCC 28846 / CBS 209.66 / NRRL 28638) TaxID=796925 RepID=A0A137PD61_CONC2|nr:hypothetical protein CONCODRAFT_4276 [Conidiobolus coronatus NRRL 28638]|eukprot:KXN72881.1 hypothetical protein CONCODRAFT_4276 [Conidiobolus coronatus NRRL 28638]